MRDNHPSPDCAQRKSGAHNLYRLRLWAPGPPLRAVPGMGAVLDLAVQSSKGAR
jgi:hypothetical protein